MTTYKNSYDIVLQWFALDNWQANCQFNLARQLKKETQLSPGWADSTAHIRRKAKNKTISQSK